MQIPVRPIDTLKIEEFCLWVWTEVNEESWEEIEVFKGRKLKKHLDFKVQKWFDER